MKFYVYELYDPQDGAVFYVGKGCRNRIDHHEAEARIGRQSRKCDKIRAIWQAGGQVGKRYVKHFDDEQQAYIFEADLIGERGLANLTNMMPGGAGGLVGPFKWTEALALRHVGTLARALRYRKISLGQYDVTSMILKVAKRMALDLGMQTFSRLMAKHNVTVRF